MGIAPTKSAGEALSEEDQRRYDAELARPTREASALRTGLASLKSLRDQALAAALTHSELRRRVAELDEHIRDD